MNIAMTLTAVALGLLLTAPAVADDGEILVYNAQHEELAQAWADDFTKATGIKVTLRNGEDPELANQLVQEGSASPADVFLTENSPGQVLVDRAGLLDKLPSEIMEEVPPAFRPSTGNWVGIAARSTVLAYNSTILKDTDLPRSIMELASPAWKGRWAAAPAGADFQAIVAAMLVLKGTEATATWLGAMKENAVSYRGNSAAMKAVNAGEVPAAIIYHYYFYGDQAATGENSSRVKLHFFKAQDPGGFLSTSGASMLKTSQHKASALAFIQWIAGRGGQTVLRTGTSFEYAIGVDAASNAVLPPLATLQPPRVDASTLDNAKVTDMMTEAGIL